MSRKDDEKPLITFALWLICCLGLVIYKAIYSPDVPWGVITFPLWAPAAIGISMYLLLGE